MKIHFMEKHTKSNKKITENLIASSTRKSQFFLLISVDFPF